LSEKDSTSDPSRMTQVYLPYILVF